MRSVRKLIAAGLGCAGLLTAAAPAVAAPALQYTTTSQSVDFDGPTTWTWDPFGGFDYISNATAVSDVPEYDGVTVMTTTYLASANAILDPSGDAYASFGITPPGGGTFFPSFEFTLKATIYETAVCTVLIGTDCVQAAFFAVGGSWDIYYDSSADANRLLGSGYVDGTKILGGSILPGVAGSFIVSDAGSGSGNFSFEGLVTFTETDCVGNDACVNPALLGTTAGAEIKIGNKTTDWIAPTQWIEGGGLDGKLVFQADGNQSFAIPEPGTLALVGLTLLGLGMSRRRRS